MVWWLSSSFCRDIDDNDYIPAEIWLGDPMMRWLGENVFENPMIYWSVWWEGDPLASSRSCPLCSTQSTRASRWNLLIYCDFARTYVITMISPKQYLTPMISPEHLSAFHHPLRRLEHAVVFFNPHPPIFKCIVKLLLKVIRKWCSQQAFINKFWFSMHRTRTFPCVVAHLYMRPCVCPRAYTMLVLHVSVKMLYFFLFNFTMIARCVLVDKCTTL